MPTAMRMVCKRVATTIIKLVNKAQRNGSENFKGKGGKIILSGCIIRKPLTQSIGTRIDQENDNRGDDEIAKFQIQSRVIVAKLIKPESARANQSPFSNPFNLRLASL